jgi:DNA-binding response OmpR family regulator
MLTAKGTETDIVVGLELGADDYIAKPFSIREFLARVKSALRRTEQTQNEPELKIGNIALYPEKFVAMVGGNQIDLTSTEFKIIEILLRRKDRVLTRAQILDNLGEDRQFVIDRTVDVHIVNIRKKLGKSGDLIQTIRSVGYKISNE